MFEKKKKEKYNNLKVQANTNTKQII